MRLALLSDIHANLQALDACLAHARAHGADQFAVLGDLVGYGAQPTAVVERVIELAAEGALVVKGNHDAMAVQPPEVIRNHGERTARWTHDQLSEAHRGWLDALPLTQVKDSLCLAHGSPHEPARWHYIYDPRAATAALAATSVNANVRFVFCGHVHEQALYYTGADHQLRPFLPVPGVAIPVPPQRQWVSTIGSVGQPRDGHTDAMYALLDTERWQLCFHRVAYDFCQAAAHIRAAGLPDFLATRLEYGR